MLSSMPGFKVSTAIESRKSSWAYWLFRKMSKSTTMAWKEIKIKIQAETASSKVDKEDWDPKHQSQKKQQPTSQLQKWLWKMSTHIQVTGLRKELMTNKLKLQTFLAYKHLQARMKACRHSFQMTRSSSSKSVMNQPRTRKAQNRMNQLLWIMLMTKIQSQLINQIQIKRQEVISQNQWNQATAAAAPWVSKTSSTPVQLLKLHVSQRPQTQQISSRITKSTTKEKYQAACNTLMSTRLQ